MAMRRQVGGRATVVLTTALAVLSFATGVLQVSATSVSGPLGALVPGAVGRTAGFTGAATGFLMLAGALGLRRRLRVAWYAVVLLVPLTALQGLAQTSVFSVPLVVLAVSALPALLLNHRQFDRALELSATQLAALAALVGTQLYGTVGAYTLRGEYTGIHTLTDALYYTIVTASTVGYGDITPTGQAARLFGMSVVLLGTASFALALGSLLGPAIEARLSRTLGIMTDRQLDLLEDHVIVLGYGDLTEPILEELEGRTEFVVITPDTAAASRLNSREVSVLTADPSDEEPLRQANIGDARAVVTATVDDATDALGILTARALNPETRIVAAATDRENVEKLRRAGADTVISPAVLGGHLLVESALDDEDVEATADELMRFGENAGG